MGGRSFKIQDYCPNVQYCEGKNLLSMGLLLIRIYTAERTLAGDRHHSESRLLRVLKGYASPAIEANLKGDLIRASRSNRLATWSPLRCGCPIMRHVGIWLHYTRWEMTSESDPAAPQRGNRRRRAPPRPPIFGSRDRMLRSIGIVRKRCTFETDLSSFKIATGFGCRMTRPALFW